MQKVKRRWSSLAFLVAPDEKESTLRQGSPSLSTAIITQHSPPLCYEFLASSSTQRTALRKKEKVKLARAGRRRRYFALCHGAVVVAGSKECGLIPMSTSLLTHWLIELAQAKCSLLCSGLGR